MKVLLTGATGFVGGHLYPALVRAGHEVRCASRHPDAARRRQPKRSWVQLDASDRVFATDDMLEGAAAFFDKREPQYRGR